MDARETGLNAIRQCHFAPGLPRPRLLFADGDLAAIRARAGTHPERQATVLAAARQHLATPGAHLECAGERHLEWLLHYAGEVSGDGLVSIVRNGGARLAVHALLPDRSSGWRWNDTTRTSLYGCSDTRQAVTRSIRYRSFAPFRAASSIEFLFVLRLGAGVDRPLPFAGTAGDWTLALPEHNGVVVPAGQHLTWQPATASGDGLP
jgi:hypothetical protein